MLLALHGHWRGLRRPQTVDSAARTLSWAPKCTVAWEVRSASAFMTLRTTLLRWFRGQSPTTRLCGFQPGSGSPTRAILCSCASATATRFRASATGWRSCLAGSHDRNSPAAVDSDRVFDDLRCAEPGLSAGLELACASQRTLAPESAGVETRNCCRRQKAISPQLC